MLWDFPWTSDTLHVFRISGAVVISDGPQKIMDLLIQKIY